MKTAPPVRRKRLRFALASRAPVIKKRVLNKYVLLLQSVDQDKLNISESISRSFHSPPLSLEPPKLFFIRCWLHRKDFPLKVSVDHRMNLRSPLDYRFFQPLMAFEFPKKVQDKMDLLTPRQFEAMTIHLHVTVAEMDKKDVRYKEFKIAWECIYPVAPEAFEYLDRVIIDLVQRKDPPDLEGLKQIAASLEAQSQTGGGADAQFPSCYMHQHAAKLCEMFEILNSIGKAPPQGCRQ